MVLYLLLPKVSSVDISVVSTSETRYEWLVYQRNTLLITLKLLMLQHNLLVYPSHPLHKHTTYFNTPSLKNQLFLTTAATQQTFPPTPHSHYNRHKTNMLHIHTSIVSMHLATIGNNTCRTIAQLGTNKSPFLISYAKSHPLPLCPLCNTHIQSTHHLFNCTHIRTTLSPLDFWTDSTGVTALLARWTEKLATSGKIGLPPLARVMGVGRQQQLINDLIITRLDFGNRILLTTDTTRSDHPRFEIVVLFTNYF